MSRPLRLEFAGALYHVTSRSNERKPIFRNESDFATFIEVSIGSGLALCIGDITVRLDFFKG